MKRIFVIYDDRKMKGKEIGNLSAYRLQIKTYRRKY